MEVSGVTSFKRRVVFNVSEQLVLLIEQEKKIRREKQEREEMEKRKGGCRSGS